MDWSSYKKILCIRLDNIGDVLMTVPAMESLKDAVPGRTITLLASSGGKAISSFLPVVDDIIEFNTPWEKNPDSFNGESVFEVVEEIRKGEFEAAVIFTVYSQNPLPAAMLCYMAGVPVVAGYCRENPYRLINEWIPDPEPFKYILHETDRQLQLVARLGGKSKDKSVKMHIPHCDMDTLHTKLLEKGMDFEKPLIVIHPGVSEEKRQYPVDLFGKAVKGIIENLNCNVVLTGIEKEKPIIDRIEKESGGAAFSLAGDLSLGELLSLIKYCPLLISNNTGPVHMASALGTSVVDLYALSNPQHYPWNVDFKVLLFAVPENLKSKNVIINYANEKAFAEQVNMPSPEDIIFAAKELLEKQNQLKIVNQRLERV